jgi:flagellar motor switch protein FliM
MTTSVRPYDFRHRETLDRQSLVTLNGAFDDFARHATMECSTLLGQPVHLQRRDVAERSWQDIVESLDDRPYVATFTLDPLDGEAILAASRDTVTRWIELRLGGGTGPLYTGHANLTDADFAVVSGVTGPLLGLLGDSLAAIERVPAERLSAALGAQQAGNHYEQMAGPTEMFLTASFDLVVANDPPVELLTAFPVALVRRVTGLHQGDRPAEGERRALDDNRVLQTPIECWLEIPAVELTPAEISELEVGNVIPFLHPLNLPLDLRAEGVLVARAKHGHVGSKIVCSITEEVVEDER